MKIKTEDSIKTKNLRFLRRLMKMGSKKSVFLFTNGGKMDEYSLVAVERENGTKNVLPVSIFLAFFLKNAYKESDGFGPGILNYTEGTGYFTSHDDYEKVLMRVLKRRKIDVRQYDERWWNNQEKVTDYM